MVTGIKKQSLRIIFIGWVFFLYSHSHAQTFNFENLDMKDGMPSSEVFDVIQDHEGYIWFATASGICCYDGYEYRTYTTHDGLMSNVILKLKLDKYDKLWFSSGDGLFGYIKDGKVFKYPVNSKLKQCIGYEHIESFGFNRSDELVFTTNAGQTYRVDSSGRITVKNMIRDTAYHLAFEYSQDLFSFSINDTKKEEQVIKSAKLKYDHHTYFLKHFTGGSNLFLQCAPVDEKEMYISNGGWLYHIKDARIINYKKIDDHAPINYLYYDHAGNLWVSVLSRGVYFFEAADLDFKPEIYFKGDIISSVFQDREHNYWITSNTQGVYFLPSISFKLLNGTEGQHIIAMDISGTKILYSKYNHGLFSASLYGGENPVEVCLTYINNTRYQIKDIYIRPQGNFWATGTDYINFYWDGANALPYKPGHSYSLYMTKDSSMLIGGLYFFVKYDLLNNQIRRYDLPGLKVRAIYESPDKNIWIGTPQGLYLKRSLEWEEKAPVLRKKINCINGIDDQVWIGTDGNGLILKEHDTLIQYNEESGLPSNSVRSIFIEKKNHIWIGTDKGLCFLKLQGNHKEIKNYTHSDGLPAYEINDIKKQGKHIYLATENGIVYFDPGQIREKEKYPVLHLSGVLVNGKNMRDSKNTRFRSDQNNLDFYFKAISFRNPGKLIYKYKLKGHDHMWHTTQSLQTSYSNLPPGSYSFLLRASIEGTSFGPEKIYSFQIKKHFTQTIFFILSIIVLSTLITFLIYRQYVLRKKRKELIKHEMLQVEHKALRMQMNPHFIFNTLVSIQKYIQENKSDLADSFLADFSTLIRLVLENSKQSFIPFVREIESISLYLKLEKMRLSGGFTYVINQDKDIQPYEDKIPPLLIQPFIENAIWHGLLPKKDNCQLIINFFRQSESHILCEIIDNGIGREEAQKNQSKYKYHKPTGMKNVSERIDIINRIHKSHMKIEVTDIMEEGKVSGTKVSLLIHYKS